MGVIHTLNHPIVGTIRWRAQNEISGAPIELLDSFEQNNIVRVFVPQLQGVDDGRTETRGDIFNGQVKFFRGATGQLLDAFAEIEGNGLKDRLISFAGSFNARLIKKKSGGPVHTPSNHAFGTAFDINSEFNGQGHAPAALGRRGSVLELVPILERHGFKWGGRFPTPDGMHFEIATLI